MGVVGIVVSGSGLSDRSIKDLDCSGWVIRGSLSVRFRYGTMDQELNAPFSYSCCALSNRISAAVGE